MEKIIIVLEKEPVYIDGVLHFKRSVKKNGLEIYDDIVTHQDILGQDTKINMFDEWVDYFEDKQKKK